jgi:hypothetical protein
MVISGSKEYSNEMIVLSEAGERLFSRSHYSGIILLDFIFDFSRL